MRVTSINLFSVVDVTMETAGFGFDDSELTFTYIKTAEDVYKRQVSDTVSSYSIYLLLQCLLL